MAIASTLKIGGALAARGRRRARAAADDLERSVMADRLSRLRYDPPQFNLWQALKTAVIVIPLLLVALWIGKWWFKKSILREFAAEQARLEQVQLAKDAKQVAQLEAQLAQERQASAEIMSTQLAEIDAFDARVKELQATLTASGKCGWDAAVVDMINGRAPPKVQKPALNPARKRR